MQGPGPAPTRSTRTGRLLQAPLPAPAPAPFAEKSRGSSATLSALGETRVSPPELAAGYGKDNVPLGPFVSAFELPPSSRGSPGGPCLPATPLSPLQLPCFLLPNRAPWPLPVLLWEVGVGRVSAAPSLGPPSLGMVDTKCLAWSPFFLARFSQGAGSPPGSAPAHHGQTAAVQADPGGPIPCPLLWDFASSGTGGGAAASPGLRAASCHPSPTPSTLSAFTTLSAGCGHRQDPRGAI